MPRPKPAAPKLPKYRHYRPKDLAVVRVDGRDHYLGAYDSPESHERYRRLMAEWLTGRQGPPSSSGDTPPSPTGRGAPSPGLSVNELLLAYYRHAEGHYRSPDGTPSRELENVAAAMKPARSLYGMTEAVAFGPLALRAVRDAMVRSGLARTTVNARVHRLRRAFRWAASVELVLPSVVAGLETVDALKRGRSAARETGPVAPVPVVDVEAALPHMPGPVAAMVRLQLLCGCRAGEVMVMRGEDLDRDGATWAYRPGSHKSAWRGRSRVITLGPRAQAVIGPLLKADPAAYLFSPRDAVAEHHARRASGRRSRPTPPEKTARKPAPGRAHAPRYDRRSYRQAICRACDRAFPHPELSRIKPKDLTEDQRAELRAWRVAHRWSPGRLRHTAATAIRARFGLEVSQNVLGHARPETTLIYAERDLARVKIIMEEIG